MIGWEQDSNWSREDAESFYISRGGKPIDSVYISGSKSELIDAAIDMTPSNTEPADDVFDTIVTLVQCFMRTSFKTKLIIILLLCLI